MGLDTVMIVISVEDAFGMKISDAEAVTLRTPCQLAAFVADRVQALPDESCITQQIYYRLRRGFRAAVPALATDFTLQIPLGEVIHSDQWSRVWTAVREVAGGPSWPRDVPWPRFFNSGPRTVRDLVWYLATALTPRRGQQPPRWTRQQVEHTVRRIILEESGVPLSFEGARTFSDLGID